LAFDEHVLITLRRKIFPLAFKDMTPSTGSVLARIKEKRTAAITASIGLSAF
jgi:hypothetical protein